jgi:hypothetical protein
VLLALGTLCYPDSFLWMAPLLGFSRPSLWQHSPPRFCLAVVLMMGCLLLLIGQLRIMGFDGAGGRGFEGVCQGLALLGVSFVFLRQQYDEVSTRITQAFVLYALVVISICTFSFVAHGEILYYARKNIYAMFYWLPVVTILLLRGAHSTKFPNAKGWAVLASLWMAVGWLSFLRLPVSELSDHLLRSRGSVSLDDRRYVERAIGQSCQVGERVLIVPPESDRALINALDARTIRLVYSNLKTLQFDIYKSSFCWFGEYVGYIEAATRWQAKARELSGKAICTKQCG